MTTHLENHLLNIAKDNAILIITQNDGLKKEFLLEGKYLRTCKTSFNSRKKNNVTRIKNQ